MLKSYAFANENGNEINRGYQCTEEQAYALAKRYANEQGLAIDFWIEGDRSGIEGEGEPAESLVTVEPD